MHGAIKRGLVGGLVAMALLGGSLAGAAAKADYTTTRSSPDGKVVFICTYDDVTGKLLFCDVIYFPVR
jgi:hypothetical protein